MTDAPREAPKTEQIADDLRARLASDEFAPGATFLTDREIRQQYGLGASSTARQLLADLAADGLIELRQGAKPKVTDFPPILRDDTVRLSAQHWGTAGRSLWDADIADRQLNVEDLVVAETTAPRWVAEALGTTEVVLRDRTFVVDGRRVAFALSYIPLTIARGTAIAQHDTGPGGTFARLSELDKAPARFQRMTNSRRVRRDEAKRLAVPAGRVVTIQRRKAATAEGEVVECTELTFDAAAFVFLDSFTA